MVRGLLRRSAISLEAGVLDIIDVGGVRGGDKAAVAILAAHYLRQRLGATYGKS
jgi:hypothetical protein